MRPILLAFCLAASLLTGCDQKAASVGTGAAFDPMAFFTGHTQSWGVVETRSGAPTEWVMTDSEGRVNDANQLRMVQHLTFQDGTVQERDWTMWRSGPGRFDATANDMVGTATGEADGNVFHWQWVLARGPGHMLVDLTMNQWMYRMADGSVLIRTTIGKFGFIATEVSERFARIEQG